MSLAALALSLTFLASAGGDPHAAHREKPQIMAPGYSALEFDAPAPGSYELPPLGQAADGKLVDSRGKTLNLHDLYGDKVVVLSFIYTSCSDVNGCPLAGFVLKQLQQKILDDPRLRDNARLVSVSFDPQTDTPEVMQRYAGLFRREGSDWRFLTCETEAALAPILAGYNQWVLRDYDEEGRYLGSISHLLRVYLIDRKGRIRNIYSPSFLHADILYADIATLLLEPGVP
jgi:cytochrome oxidase Cu insertion factor (SCO1/SenC/PrrC family)